MGHIVIQGPFWAILEYGCKLIYAGLPSFFVWGWRTSMFQLCGFYCTGMTSCWLGWNSESAESSLV